MEKNLDNLIIRDWERSIGFSSEDPLTVSMEGVEVPTDTSVGAYAEGVGRTWGEMLRGAVAGTLGAGGDVESIMRGLKSAYEAEAGEGSWDAFLAGMAEETVLPTTQRVSEVMPEIPGNEELEAAGAIGEMLGPGGVINAGRAGVKAAKAVAPAKKAAKFFEDTPNDSVDFFGNPLTKVKIPVKDVQHGESAMPGGKMTWDDAEARIFDYSKRETDIPPISVMADDEFGIIVNDGSHRLEAAKRKGQKYIEAYVDKEDLPFLEKRYGKKVLATAAAASATAEGAPQNTGGYRDTFVNYLMENENAAFASGKAKTARHKSPEGGRDTVGFGHKLTAKEEKEGKIYGIPIKDIDVDKAKQILIKDIKRAATQAKTNLKSMHPNVDFDSLSEDKKEMLTDIQFNVKGGGIKTFPNFVQGLVTDDVGLMKKEYKRYYTTTKGAKREVKKRNTDFFNMYLKNL